MVHCRATSHNHGKWSLEVGDHKSWNFLVRKCGVGRPRLRKAVDVSRVLRSRPPEGIQASIIPRSWSVFVKERYNFGFFWTRCIWTWWILGFSVCQSVLFSEKYTKCFSYYFFSFYVCFSCRSVVCQSYCWFLFSTFVVNKCIHITPSTCGVMNIRPLQTLVGYLATSIRGNGS